MRWFRFLGCLVASLLLLSGLAVNPVRLEAAHPPAINSVAFAPDGTTFLTDSTDGTAQLWDAKQGKSLCTFNHGGGQVLSVAFSPDGKSILTGGTDKTARLWDISQLSLPCSASVSQPVATFTRHTGFVTAVAFSPDGKSILTGSADNTAYLWDMVVTPATPNPDATPVAFPPSSTTAKELNATAESASTTSGIKSVAFSPDGSEVITGNQDYTATVWDVKKDAQVLRLSGHTGPVLSVTFSPDGNYILTGSADTTAQLWDAATGKNLQRFAGHRDRVLSVAFSPDGKYILTGGADDLVVLWDAKSGAIVQQFSGHTDAVASVAFSPDGTQILTGSADGTAIVWDVSTKAKLVKISIR